MFKARINLLRFCIFFNRYITLSLVQTTDRAFYSRTGVITLRRCERRETNRDFAYSPNILRWLDRLFGTVSRRDYQTLILKSRDKKLRLTINSFNLHHFFSPVVALEDNDDFDPTTDTNYFLIMLVFVISETWGYRLGLEIINGRFCGKLLCLRKITKCYQKWHGKLKSRIPRRIYF